MFGIKTCCALMGAAALLLWAGGCASGGMPFGSSRQASAAPPPRVTPAPVELLVSEGVKRLVSFYPPGATRENACATLEKAMPVEIAANQPFDYEITVTAASNGQCLDDVTVRDRIHPGFKLISATPPADSSEGGDLRWALGQMQPRETRVIRVTGVAGEPGKLANCAVVTCTPRSCIEVAVVQPSLKLSLSAPAEICMCDPIAVKYTVSNSGTGWAKNVRIKQMLPEGLVTQDGKAQFEIAVGSMKTGESKDFPLVFKAIKTGRFDCKPTAVADNNLFAEAVASTIVHLPVLSLKMAAPEHAYLGRSFSFDLTLSNVGDHTSRSTVLTTTLPAGLKVIEVGSGGQAVGGQISWNVGDLAANDARQFRVTVAGAAEGLVKASASTQDKCAASVSAYAQTTILGIPGIQLEVTDVADPVELGQNAVYDIVVTNQGSTPATNIAITCNLEKSMQYVSGTGATNVQAANGKVTFAPLASLAPKAKATWRVTVKAVETGDVRFGAEMKSDQLTRPVTETEATTFFK